MSELIKHEKDEIYVERGVIIIPQKLLIPKKTRDIYLSGKNFPKVRLIEDKNEVVKSLHSYLNQTIMDKGVNMPSEEITYLKMRVTEDIMREFSHYTLEEIRLACLYGVRGELGEYFGINPTTIYGWLKKFRYKLLPPITTEMNRYLPKPKEVKRSQKEKDFDIANRICEVYFTLWKDGTYDYYDFNNFGYKFLDKLDLLEMSNEKKWELMTESRNSFKRNISKKNRGKRVAQRIDLSRAYKELEKASNPTFEEQIRIGAMRLAIYHYLYDLASEDVDLKKLIDKKLSNINYEDEK